MIQMISLVADNQPGVLARITGLLTARGFNIESLTAAHTHIPGLSRLTIVVEIPEKQQSHKQKSHAVKQLDKIVDVIHAVNLSEIPSLHRELALIKARISPKDRPAFLADIKRFEARLLESKPHGDFLEISADPETVEAFIEELTKYGTLEVARSGAVGLPHLEEHEYPKGGKKSWQSGTMKPMETSVH